MFGEGRSNARFVSERIHVRTIVASYSNKHSQSFPFNIVVNDIAVVNNCGVMRLKIQNWRTNKFSKKKMFFIFILLFIPIYLFLYYFFFIEKPILIISKENEKKLALLDLKKNNLKIEKSNFVLWALANKKLKLLFENYKPNLFFINGNNRILYIAKICFFLKNN